jgi:predicted nucleotidyltransferase
MQHVERKRKEYARALDRAVARAIEQLSRMPEVDRAILFGSYANGRRDLFTDLDVLVVMKSDLDFVSRTADLYGRLDMDVDFDLLVYTPEELDRRRETGFVQHVLKTGKVIYEKDTTGRGQKMAHAGK